MTAYLAQAECPLLLNAKGGFADWEYEQFSVGSTCSGLSDVISLQSSDGGSPVPADDPPRLESLQSFTSAFSPMSDAAWAATDLHQQGHITSSEESMDWTRSLSVGADDALEPAAVGEKKDATRAAKRVRRREQQKVAQQRYRQKQRHWAAEMEVKVEELTKIHDAVQAEQRSLAARRASLEDNVNRMEAALAQKTAQAAALRERLGTQQPACEIAEPHDAEPQQSAETAALRLSVSVAAIQSYVKRQTSKHGLDLQSLPADELQRLLGAYHSAAAACPAESPAEAPEAAAKSTAGALKGIVKALQLTPVQRQTLGWIRDRQLRKVVALADARRELIMRAMSQMLPSLRMTAADLEERLSSLPQASDVTGVTEAAQLDATIDTIKANIKEERRAAAELDDLVMHRALTPLQLAVFIVESFPSRPDGFAVVEAVTCMPGLDKAVVRTRRARQ